MPPKISVITINYNNKEGLERTLQNVTSQTFDDFEYIVIDGGSQDGSKELLQKYSGKITHWVSERDKGIYNAMNKGIVAAKGEYLIFINSGDHFYSENSLTIGAKYLGEKEIVYSDLKVVNHASLDKFIYPSELHFSYFFESSLPHPATFIKKSAFQKYGLYDENLKIVSDWKWFMNAICRFDCSYTHIPEIISTFYFDGISSQDAYLQKINEERQLVLTSEYPRLKDDLQELMNLRLENTRLKFSQSKFEHLKKYKLVKLLDKIGLIKIYH